MRLRRRKSKRELRRISAMLCSKIRSIYLKTSLLQLQFITKANHKLYRAYLLKENLCLIFEAEVVEIAGTLTK